MGNRSTVVAVTIGFLLLFLVLFRRKKIGLNTEFSNFFSDAEIVDNLEEAPLATSVPASMMQRQKEGGVGETDCEKSGYMSFNFPNPTPNPITLDIVNPQTYYQTLEDYSASQLNSNTNYNVGEGVSLFACVYANSLFYSIQISSFAINIYNPLLNTTSNVNISPNKTTTFSNIISYNGMIIISGIGIVTIIDANPSSPTYNTVLVHINCTPFIELFSISVFGNIIYVIGLNSTTYKISLKTFSLIGSFTTGLNSIVSTVPSYSIGQITNRYIYYFGQSGGTTNTVHVYDTFTDSVIAIPSLSNNASGQPCIVGNNIYVPEINNIDVFSTISNTIIANIPTTISGLFAQYNGQSTVYITSGTNPNVLVINTNTNTIITTIVTGFTCNSLIVNNHLLYVGDFGLSGNIDVIDVNETSATFNQITAYISTGLVTLTNPVLIINGLTTNVSFVSEASSNISNSLISIPPSTLTDSVAININNMANMQQNPGEICGIFYRSLTVEQMSNILSVDFNEATGEKATYKLVPITYKDAMSMLNQIYISKFYKPIVINNTINLHHVINPGENVYIKIYVRNYVANTTLLETGKIEASETGTGIGAIYNADKEYAEVLDDQEKEAEQDWMTVEEVESGQWGAIHIQCEEEGEIQEQFEEV